MNDAIKQAMQEAEDAKMREKAEKAYNAASSTPPASKVVKKAKGGSVASASRRADGIAQKGKTKGRYI